MKINLAVVAILIFCLSTVYCDELLDGVPIYFKLAGEVTYTPSSGGISIPGYKLKLVYSKYQWIGVRFMQVTSFGNTDVLIFQRSVNQSSGNYQCSVGEYYSTSVRPETLLTDTVNRMDRKVTSYSTNNDFGLEMDRTRGQTNGEDWQGSQFLRVCFFTSNQTFDANQWKNQFQSCYGYDINSRVSTFKGKSIATMSVDGVDSLVYGGFSGPLLKLELFVYRPSASLTGPTLIIKLGDRVSSTVGFDYYKCQDSDYHGESYTEMTKDLTVSGYEDGGCALVQSSSSTKIHFQRNVVTADQFDCNITLTSVKICFYFTSEDCVSLTFDYLFPIMSVSSAVRLFNSNLQILIFFLMATFTVVWL